LVSLVSEVSGFLFPDSRARANINARVHLIKLEKTHQFEMKKNKIKGLHSGDRKPLTSLTRLTEVPLSLHLGGASFRPSNRLFGGHPRAAWRG
jgi:hypothetical protein